MASRKAARKTKKAKAKRIKVQDNLVGLSLAGAVQHKTLEVLTEIGSHDGIARENIVAALRQIEKQVKLPQGRSLREELTGPMTDALFKNAKTLHKTLKDGTKFDFAYRSKIARDFILSPAEKPDHMFEPQTTRLFLHLAKGAKHIIIGGAYCGDHAVPGAKVIAKVGGIVHGFEPSDEQRALLLRNAKQNGVARNVRGVALGLWDKALTLELVGDDAFAHAVPLRGSSRKGKITFPATSIESYARKNGIKNVDLILLDIEGSELPALRGAQKFLEQPAGIAPDIIFEVHRYYVDWSKGGLGNTPIVKFLRGLGYHVYAIRDFQSNVPMADCKVELIRPEDTYLDGPPHGFNMLAVKDAATIKGPLFRTVKGVSPKLLLHKSPKLHWPQEWQKKGLPF